MQLPTLIKRLTAFVIAAMLSFTLGATVFAETGEAEYTTKTVLATNEKPLRRPVSPDSPMWLIHIDSWNEADPEKIIDLIPEDLLPYVVFNISLSINWDEDAKRFVRVEYGYETAKSWLRACAERGVWAMIQPASGGPCHFPDYDPSEIDYEDTIYAEFFRDYPNFIGFNYCEQFWGFAQDDFPTTAEERYLHFAGLLKLCKKYGGYLVESWCGNQWSPSINPLAMIKRIPEFEDAARTCSDNYILLEKYTQTGYLFDMESLVLGTYLSGYCGNFGLRYDSSGWTDESGQGTGGYTLATGLTVQLERMILNGATVIDGPELTWVDDFGEVDPEVGKDGYSSRQWKYKDQFYNVMMSMFRKAIDGTFRIPTREEVIKRIGYILVNDIETGTDDNKYSIPNTLTEGLYQMDNDGALRDNHSFYKKTGRYPTIPTTAGFADSSLEALFTHVIKSSEYNSYWPTVEDKVAELNEVFPDEYDGDLYASHYDNVWITYNPYKRSQTGTANIPLLYNSGSSIDLSYPRYTTGIIKELSDGLEIYLNNYDNTATLVQSTDVIKINGASAEPKIEYTEDSINCLAADVKTEWSSGVYTITVKHNGPISIKVDCSGSETGKPAPVNDPHLVDPGSPEPYYGTLQHEAESFDTANIMFITKNGSGGGIRNYYGQGYINFGNAADAKVRDTFSTLVGGSYTLKIRYSALKDISDGLVLYINGKKVTNVELAQTDGFSDWKNAIFNVKLKKGENKFELKSKSELADQVYLDCITLDLVEAGSSGSGIGIWIAVGIIFVVAIAIAIITILTATKKKKA